MKIHEWLQGFLTDLRDAFPPADWPDPGTEAYDAFFELFRKAFARNGVSEAEARESLALQAEAPPRWKAEAIQKTLDAVKINREINPPGADRADDRESATDASKGCPHCHGQGLALVYAARPDPDRRIPPDTSAYCVCALGRWIEQNHREKSPDVHKRTPDLKSVLAGRSAWRLDPPGLEGMAATDAPARGVADLVRTWTAAAREESARPAPAPARPRPDLGRVEPAVPIPAARDEGRGVSWEAGEGEGGREDMSPASPLPAQPSSLEAEEAWPWM